MNFLQQLFPDQLSSALGWTVIHSLWQGLILATLLYLLLHFFKHKSAQWKYLLANLFLLAILGMAAGTFVFLYESSRPMLLQQADGLVLMYQPTEWTSTPFPGAYQTLAPLDQFSLFLSEHISLITTLWLAGLLFFGLRLTGGLLYVQYLKLSARLPQADHWQHMLDDMADRLKVSYPVFLMESSKTTMPMAIGFIKPVILFPLGMVNRLPIEQVEAVLAHELAHIHRYDYLSNIVQSAIETLLYFNPAVWWISAIIRRERENRCDDLAVELCGSSLTYAKALVSLQDHQNHSPHMAMALSRNKNQLLNRIKRILKQPPQNSSTMEKLIVSCLLLSCVFIFSLGAQQSDAKAIEPQKEWAYPAPENEPTELYFPEPERSIAPQPDTLLPKGKMTLRMTENDSTIDLQIENGAINYLIINGREIPEKDLPQYESYVKNLIRSLPEPPAPPAPPSPPTPKVPQAPPAPPAPPVPPAPPHWKSKKGTKITTERDENGNTVIYMDEGDHNQPFELRLDEHENLIINGDTIRPGENVFFFRDHNDSLSPSYREMLEQAQEMKEQVLRQREQHLQEMEQLHEQLKQNKPRNKKEKMRELKEIEEQQMQMRQEIEKAQQEMQQARQLMEKEIKHQLRENQERKGSHSFFYVPDGQYDFRSQELDFQVFERALIKDGLIKEGDDYQMDLSDQLLKVNGQALSEELHQKYLKMAEEMTGAPVEEEGYNLSVKKKAGKH